MIAFVSTRDFGTVAGGRGSVAECHKLRAAGSEVFSHRVFTFNGVFPSFIIVIVWRGMILSRDKSRRSRKIEHNHEIDTDDNSIANGSMIT
jgi:hypothetical protein